MFSEHSHSDNTNHRVYSLESDEICGNRNVQTYQHTSEEVEKLNLVESLEQRLRTRTNSQNVSMD